MYFGRFSSTYYSIQYRMNRFLLGALCAFVISVGCASASMSCDKQLLPDLTYSLSGQNLAWPCASTRTIYETNGRYVPKNIIATRIQIYKDEVFVAQPRFKVGVPFTLGVVSLKNKGCAATITPFPCWSMQEEGNCGAIQSAVDVFLDAQDILWVLDAGIVYTLESQPVRRCAPKVLGINVKTGKVVKVVDLSTLVSAASRLQYLAVDLAEDGCIFLYISDAATRAIIVFDVLSNRGFRVVLPKAVTLGCARRDVLYLALARKSCGATVLYFTYLSSSRMFSIKTVHLRKGSTNGAVVDVGVKNAKIVLLGTDGGAALFFRNKGESDIYMWNTDTCFKSDNFLLVQKGGECRLATGVVPGYKRLMWVIESNFQDFIQNTIGCAGASVVIHPLVKSCDD
ncbi:major royal jelly protein 1 [Neodiprion pinetum]|uniref:major royal jelly protein 1 n=1 Tax=Neodiprion pinetum TaxID=441929 RepID=UPI001EDD8661|nr:major royal jelly protein 1-like [Neodiprion pinetum]